MAYLDWSGLPSPSHAEQGALAPRDGRITVRFHPEQRAELVSALEELLQSGEELRMELPLGWLIFWKLRETESRFLLAHPEIDRWVATVALEREAIPEIATRIGRLAKGSSLNLSEIGPIGSVSNLDLILELT